MMRRIVSLAVMCAAIFGVTAVNAQTDDADRRDTRARLNALLTSYGSTVNMSLHQSDKNEWNFAGTLTQDLKNGADDTGDVLAHFEFTLESGFPNEAIKVVLRSIKLQDQYVGQMRPDIDGSSAE